MLYIYKVKINVSKFAFPAGDNWNLRDSVKVSNNCFSGRVRYYAIVTMSVWLTFIFFILMHSQL